MASEKQDTPAPVADKSLAKMAAITLSPAVLLTIIVAAVDSSNKQPAGDCTKFVSAWLWVYIGGLIAFSTILVVMMIWSSGPEAPRSFESLTTPQKAAGAAQALLAFFNFVWWIVGMAWHSKAEDANCVQGGMDMMLTLLILPALVMVAGCCAACIMGGKLIAKFRGPGGEEAMQAMAEQATQAMAKKQMDAIAKNPEKFASALAGTHAKQDGAVASDPDTHTGAITSDPDKFVAAFEGDSAKLAAAIESQQQQFAAEFARDPRKFAAAIASDPDAFAASIERDAEKMGNSFVAPYIAADNSARGKDQAAPRPATSPV